MSDTDDTTIDEQDDGRTRGRQEVPEEAIRVDLRHVAERLGHPPRTTEYERIGEYHRETLRRKFGSWADALTAAGLDPDARPDKRGTQQQSRLPGDGNKEVTTRETAMMHLLRALNLYHTEIGEIVGRPQSTVQDKLTETADRVRDGEDPVDVYADVMEPMTDPFNPRGGNE